MLARSGLAVNPLEDDVVVQIRPEGGTDVFCARIPAADFTKRHRAFEFGDRKHSVASARGLDGMKIKLMPDGSFRLRTRGKRAQMICPNPGRRRHERYRAPVGRDQRAHDGEAQAGAAPVARGGEGITSRFARSSGSRR